METITDFKKIIKIWGGEDVPTEINQDLLIHKRDIVYLAVDKIESCYRKKGVIIKPF